jgi:hypothetical protein
MFLIQMINTTSLYYVSSLEENYLPLHEEHSSYQCVNKGVKQRGGFLKKI